MLPAYSLPYDNQYWIFSGNSIPRPGTLLEFSCSLEYFNNIPQNSDSRASMEHYGERKLHTGRMHTLNGVPAQPKAVL